MSELALLRRFRAHAPSHPWLKLGPGHDCALLDWPSGRALAFKIDQVVEGVHFVLSGPGAADPRQVGWKAAAKACSDLAAAGCWPVAASAALHLRRNLGDAWAWKLFQGLRDCGRRFSFALAGGDFSSGPGPVSVAVSLLGEGPPILGKQGRRRAGEGGREGPWRRSGARPGDCLLVTGDLGGSRARKHLSFLPRLEEARLLRELAAGAVHAAIDVSDGLSRDLNHLCNESRCGVELDARRIPLSRAARASPHPLAAALGDGEDFELLLALAPEAADYVLRHWRHSTPLTRIGRFLSWTEGRWLRTSRGRRVQLPDLGYEHQTGRPKKRGHE